jgi:4-carboxymuconolactone decarboxylase
MLARRRRQRIFHREGKRETRHWKHEIRKAKYDFRGSQAYVERAPEIEYDGAAEVDAMRIRTGLLAMVMVLAPGGRAIAQDRMPEIPADKLTEAQKKAAEQFMKERQRPIFGPFVALERSPEVMLRAEAMGEYLRFHNVIPQKLMELAIIITARQWTQQYEWNAHDPLAIKAGLSADIVKAIADGRHPQGMSSDEDIVYDFCTELNRNKSVSDATYARALGRFGEQGVIELTSLAGYYTFLSMVMNTTRTQVPKESTTPALAPLP